MCRPSRTDVIIFKNMNTYSHQDKVRVWNMASIVPGYDHSQYRRDRCGALIAWEVFGDRDSIYGWEVDHIIFVSKRG